MSIHSLLHPSGTTAPDAGVGTSEVNAAGKPPLDVHEAADCCCAIAQVRVVMPPVAGRNARPELRMCAHHYRASAARLSAAGADVYDARGRWIPARKPYWAVPDRAATAPQPVPDTVGAPVQPTQP